MTPIKVAQFGLGPIGIETLKLAACKPWIKIVGGVDIDPAKQGKSLGDLTGIAELEAARVHPSFEELWSAVQPRVVLHTAGSRAESAIAQIEPMAQRGACVVSSCEELLFPNLRAPRAAARLDALCRESGALVVGTGVNPGFVMDLLPVCLTGVSRMVRRIYVERVVDASTRRLPLQRKIGSGLDPAEFTRLFQGNAIGHAGLRESVALIAHSMGWELGEIRETGDPVVATSKIETSYLQVPAGSTCGLHQRAIGFVGGEERIELDLKMYLGAPDPHDLVRIDGDPPVEALIKGGIAGDQATVAALVNAVPRILQAVPGLRLMTDLTVPAWR